MRAEVRCFPKAEFPVCHVSAPGAGTGRRLAGRGSHDERLCSIDPWRICLKRCGNCHTTPLRTDGRRRATLVSARRGTPSPTQDCPRNRWFLNSLDPRSNPIRPIDGDADHNSFCDELQSRAGDISESGFPHNIRERKLLTSTLGCGITLPGYSGLTSILRAVGSRNWVAKPSPNGFS